jgi:hypothetical protein
MAMVRETLEAANGNNNDNTLMVNNPEAMLFLLQFYLSPVLSPAPP